MKKIKNLSIFISVIFFACILIGCDISSVEKAFGLDMHSESSSDDNDSSAKVEIEYLDDKKIPPRAIQLKNPMKPKQVKQYHPMTKRYMINLIYYMMM